jgi:hypothetical protein
MEPFEFIAEHPWLTVILLLTVFEGIKSLILAAQGKEDDHGL